MTTTSLTSVDIYVDGMNWGWGWGGVYKKKKKKHIKKNPRTRDASATGLHSYTLPSRWNPRTQGQAAPGKHSLTQVAGVAIADTTTRESLRDAPTLTVPQLALRTHTRPLSPYTLSRTLTPHSHTHSPPYCPQLPPSAFFLTLLLSPPHTHSDLSPTHTLHPRHARTHAHFTHPYSVFLHTLNPPLFHPPASTLPSHAPPSPGPGPALLPGTCLGPALMAAAPPARGPGSQRRGCPGTAHLRCRAGDWALTSSGGGSEEAPLSSVTSAAAAAAAVAVAAAATTPPQPRRATPGPARRRRRVSTSPSCCCCGRRCVSCCRRCRRCTVASPSAVPGRRCRSSRYRTGTTVTAPLIAPPPPPLRAQPEPAPAAAPQRALQGAAHARRPAHRTR